jgi:hypothetical protein
VQPEGTTFNWGIQSLTFSNGSEVQLEPSSVTLLIGPNSSGKSLALRNIQQFVQRSGITTAAVPGLQVFREGDPTAFTRWLKSHYPLRRIGSSEHFMTRGSNLEISQVVNIWGDSLLSPANAFLDPPTRCASSTDLNYIHAKH